MTSEIAFGSGGAARASGVASAREAVARARRGLAGVEPALALAFVSGRYPDVAEIPRAIAEDLGGEIPVLGGVADGAVFDGDCALERGVSVVLIGGRGVAVHAASVAIRSPGLVELVPIARRISGLAESARRDGLRHFTCLVFAPGDTVDGEGVVAALRKGLGGSAPLAGAMLGDAGGGASIFVEGQVWPDRVALAGIFSQRPLGVATRHGWRAVGPARQVTRCEGQLLVSLDHRPALDVWIDDIRAAGGAPPSELPELVRFLYGGWGLGIQHGGAMNGSFLIRAPLALANGGIWMSATLAEGVAVRLMNATDADLLRASRAAATDACDAAGGKVAGALVLACSSRLQALGARFAEEIRGVQTASGAPLAGACVRGEIARTSGSVDAFFNSELLVLAFPAG